MQSLVFKTEETRGGQHTGAGAAAQTKVMALTLGYMISLSLTYICIVNLLCRLKTGVNI